MNDEKILLVDDEKEFIDTLSERMVLRGMRVVTASSGKEAVSLVGKEKFDCIILDMQMPGMDGLQAMSQMMNADKDQQVIILTGHATIDTAKEALKLGALDFLEKPADINALIEKIKEAKMNRLMAVEAKSREMVEKIMKSKGW